MRFTEVEEQAIIARSGLDFLPAIWTELKAAYSTPLRFYHDWTHALSVLSYVNTICDEFHPDLLQPFSHRDLRLAALFHDVVYVPGAPSGENERLSSEFMKARIPGTYYAESLIEATARHGKIEAHDVKLAIALFMDCDIATFGELRWEVVRWNDDNVGHEFRQVFTPEQYSPGRRAFLSGMLAKHSIFLSDYFRTRFEAQARKNIQRLIGEL